METEEGLASSPSGEWLRSKAFSRVSLMKAHFIDIKGSHLKLTKRIDFVDMRDGTV